jgi:hypothetical protein
MAVAHILHHSASISLEKPVAPLKELALDEDVVACLRLVLRQVAADVRVAARERVAADHRVAVREPVAADVRVAARECARDEQKRNREHHDHGAIHLLHLSHPPSWLEADCTMERFEGRPYETLGVTSKSEYILPFLLALVY